MRLPLLGNISVKHSYAPNDLTRNFTILKSARTSLTVSFVKCVFINELRSGVNVQSDSICAKGF